jgi:hypothetical protein
MMLQVAVATVLAVVRLLVVLAVASVVVVVVVAVVTQEMAAAAVMGVAVGMVLRATLGAVRPFSRLVTGVMMIGW